MKCDFLISAVDTHTGGAPTRIIYDQQIMGIRGNSMKEKQEFVRKNYDFIRRALMQEPRGYSEMTGAILTHPTAEGSDFGLIFLDHSGYVDLCGHAIVGAATAAFELGWINSREQKINFDTIAGPVPVRVKYKDGKVIESTMQNVASYSFGEVTLDFEGKKINADIAYSGNIFAILSASDFDFPATSGHANEWSKLGIKIRDSLNQSESLRKLTAGRSVSVVEFNAAPTNKDAHFKSIVIFGNGQVDREPCATGTCAKMACLFKKGKLQVGDRLVQESIIGTLASATVIGITEIEGHKAILPEVTYSVFVTGLHQYLIDESDPLKEGYQIP